MAHFLRAKQAGISKDFSQSIDSDMFSLDDLARFGISSQVAHVAYDPVQAIIAIGTKSTKFGPGQVYIFGEKRVKAQFTLTRQGASVREMQFCSDRLVVLDTKNDIAILSLPERKWLSSYSPPGTVTAIASDSTLDYVIIGLGNGELLVYDMDREVLAPYRVPNLWAEHNPRSRSVPIVSMQFHPRDIGKLLIGYIEGALIYSFKKDEPRKFFQYHLPAGAPGGDADPKSIGLPRYPRLTHATWHPTGTFILTAHEDSSLVVWDPKDGRVVVARTISETGIDQPSRAISPIAGKGVPRQPITKIVWCANQDPDDTGLLIAGGGPVSLPGIGLTFFELGRTPNYATATWQLLAEHFETPRRHRMLPTPAGVDVTGFCLIPRKSPWFAGAQDPIAVIAVLSSGEMTTMSFPSGFTISPTNLLHPSMSFVHPFVTSIALTQMDREKWLGKTETRQTGPPILRGGAEAPRQLKRFEARSVISTTHADGTVKLWDLGHSDQIENETMLQVDVARAVGRLDNVHITCDNFSGFSTELAVGLRSGELAIFRWARNPRAGSEGPAPCETLLENPLILASNEIGKLTNIQDRRDPSLVEGLHPFTLLNQGKGACTSVKVSDVGFVAAGFEGGSLVVIDMRGPALIFNTDIKNLAQKERSGPFRKKSLAATSDWVTCLEFSVMVAEGDDYSSIMLHAGTAGGQVITLKILPEPSGRYAASILGSTFMEGRVHLIHPLHVSSGNPTLATPSVVGILRNGVIVDGSLLVISVSEARVFRPPSAKGAHRSWDGALCEKAAVSKCRDHGIALVGLFGDGTTRSYSIPGLKEIASMKLDNVLDSKRFAEDLITEAGEIIGWTGPSELAMLGVWGMGEVAAAQDNIFNPAILIPPRPTISNFQWVSGTQYITPSDMDILISGADRPPSRRMLAQARADEAARRSSARSGGASSSDEGYWAYMQRQVQERTERLGFVSERMDTLEENSSGWAEDVNKFVSRQKRNFIMGAVKGKMGI